MRDMDDSIRTRRNILIVEVIICILLGVFFYVLNEFKITSIIVQGNKHYSVSEISNIIENGWFGDNSLIVSLKYRHKAFKNLPFVETMEVKVEDRNTIRVVVYEKALAGYIRYLDRYMYFDKDGIIVENADVPTEGIPLVTGLEFERLTMYEPLPVRVPREPVLVEPTICALAEKLAAKPRTRAVRTIVDNFLIAGGFLRCDYRSKFIFQMLYTPVSVPRCERK